MASCPVCREKGIILSLHLPLCSSGGMVDKDRCDCCYSGGRREQCYRCAVVWTCGSEKCKEKHEEICKDIIITPFYKSELHRQVQRLCTRMVHDGTIPRTPMSIVFVGFHFHLPKSDITSVRALTVESIEEYNSADEFVRAFLDEQYARGYLDRKGMIKNRYRGIRFFMYKEDAYSIRVAVDISKIFN